MTNPETAGIERPATLAIDIGGTGLKASILDSAGRMATDRVRAMTPPRLTPRLLVSTLGTLVEPLPPYDRVSVGFPGVVRNGTVRTAPNLGSRAFQGFDLAAALEQRLGKPVRVVNDADMQGWGAVRGAGVEMVITLGTGFGSSLFIDGRLGPHLELAHHPFRKGRTYEEELGERARKKLGRGKWNRRVHEAIDQLRGLTTFDHLYIGGGNARKLEPGLPDDVSVVDNAAGILGGIRLWDAPLPGRGT